MEKFKFVFYEIMAGSVVVATAAVVLKKGDQEIREASIGNDPIDAIFNCIDRIVGHSAKLLEYKVEALTTGKDALGEASLKVRINDAVYSGRGTSPDVLEASARAYLNAYNCYSAYIERAEWI